jgi:glucans biosynthesis protein C
MAVAADAPQRTSGLDVLRASAMLLGVAYHSAWAYVPDIGPWYVVADAASHPFFKVFTSVVHSFRMQVFFALSGFFSHLVFEKRPKTFLKERFRRLMVPFCVCLPAVWLADALIRHWASSADLMDNRYQWHAGVFRAVPLHLWFLEYLFLFSLLAALSAQHWPAFRVGRFPVVTFFFLSLAAGLSLVALPEAAPDASFFPQPQAMVHYGVFFYFGWLLYPQQSQLEALKSQALAFLGIGLALSLWVFGRPVEYSPLGHFAQGFIAGAYVLSFLSFALKLLNFTTPFLSFAVESSYWVYLAHYPVVMALHVALAPLPWPVFLKYVVVLALTLTLCGVSALGMRRTPFAAILGFKAKREFTLS